MHTLILSLVLVSTPLEDKVDRLEREALLPMLRDYWIAMGVLEKEGYFFQNVWALESDVADMQWRMDNTPPDAPSVLARHHLPLEGCFKNWMEGHLYVQHLEDIRDWLLPGDEQGICDAVIADTKNRMDVWYALYQVSGNWWGREGLRYRLWELKKLVGDDVFYGTKPFPEPLPPHALFWDWQEGLEVMNDPG